uniref:Radial spoke head component 1 n=1 Tax=Stegastes partitus TaxID=144197 RepID=A0A3B4ZV22_9TELE
YYLVGEFVCNKPMGRGVYTWPDGNSYEGEVYSGIRHGSGTYKCTKNYLSYKGQWYQGERHGKGTVYYNEDKTSWYKGEWMKNNREGWGVRCYPSGNIYSGEWKNNMRHGEGTMKWLKQGQEYVGTWQDGVQVSPSHSTLSRKVTSLIQLYQIYESHELSSLAAWPRHTCLDPEASGRIPVFPEQSLQGRFCTGPEARTGNLSLC